MHGGGLSLVCLSLLGSGILPLGVSAESYGLCDSTILDEMDTYQCLHGRPGRIMKRADKNTYLVALTTKDFLPPDVKCVYSKVVVTGDNFNGTDTTTTVYTNGTVTTRLDPVHESCGAVIAPAILNKYYTVAFNGLWAFVYACTTDSSAVASDVKPAMFIKIKQGYQLTEKDSVEIDALFPEMGYTGEVVDYRQQCPNPSRRRRAPVDDMSMDGM